MARLREFPATIAESDKAKLAQREVQCVELFCEDGFTQAEIGTRLGITRQAVGQALDRARDKISGGGGQNYTHSLKPGDIEHAIAMA